MAHRRRGSRLRVGLLVGALLAGSIVVGSVASLGGFGSERVDAADGDTRRLTSAQLEWNPRTDDSSLYPRAVRVTAGAGETFHRDDTVDITAIGPGSDTCTAKATVAREGARALDVPFVACGVPLWELHGVTVTVAGPGGGTAFRSKVQEPAGSTAAFNGDVVRPTQDVTVSYTTTRAGGRESVRTLRLAVAHASVAQLVGNRFMAMASTGENQTSPWIGTIGTKQDNNGIWVETDAQNAVPTVVADLGMLTEGRVPQVEDLEQYRLVVLQPQQLGAHQTSADQYAVSTAMGTVADARGGAHLNVSTALEPVSLDERLEFTVVQRDEQTIPSLSFCYTFRVTNISDAPVDWQVTFDTTKQPLWGMDPTAVRPSKGVGIQSLWGGETSFFDADTGLWTIGGDASNTTIPPAGGNDEQSVEVGYCVQPPVPPVKRDAFTAPTFSVDGDSDTHDVALRVKLASPSQFLVPWEAEVDLADYVCASTLPNQIRAERATLTHLEGTRYLLQGNDPDTTFVSANRSQDFTFAHYNPRGKPFELGKCP